MLRFGLYLGSRRLVTVAAFAAAAVALAGCSGGDDAPKLPSVTVAAQNTAAVTSTIVPVQPTATASPTPTKPAGSPTTVATATQPAARGVDGLNTGGQSFAVQRAAPALPASPFAAVPGREVILFDIAAKKMTDLGVGERPSFSPDSTKMAWMSGDPGTGTNTGDIKVMELATGTTKTIATGRFARFLDADHVTYFTTGNNKASFDLKSNTATPVTGNDDEAYFERLDAARSTTSDGYRIVASDDPQATTLPRGTKSTKIMRVTDTKTGSVALQFRAFAAAPAGKGVIAMAAEPRNGAVGIYLVDIGIGKAEFIGSTALSEALPFAADDNRVIWSDGYCGPKQGDLYVYERASKTLVEWTNTPGLWVTLTPSGQIGLGEFGPYALFDAATFTASIRLPEKSSAGSGADTSWSPDYRFAAYGAGGGHGGYC